MSLADVNVPIDLRGDPRRHRRETLIRLVFLAAAMSSLFVSAAIVLSLAGEAITFLTNIELGSLWTTGWYPRRGLFDVKTLFMGTLLTTGVAMIIAVPVGLCAAIYLSEYAPPRVRRVLKPVLEILAGIPSVVLGFFALTWINPELVQVFNPQAENFNLAAAGVGIAVLIAPLIASISEDALRAVPMSLREASYGIGARRVTTSVRIVVPAAVSGIVASFIIAASRAVGETMVVAIAAGSYGGWNTDVFKPGQTLTAAMANLASGSDRVRGVDQAFNSLFFLGLLLFFVTLALNMLGNVFVRRIRNRY
jgi:phosphate transport system permease protein